MGEVIHPPASLAQSHSSSLSLGPGSQQPAVPSSTSGGLFGQILPLPWHWLGRVPGKPTSLWWCGSRDSGPRAQTERPSAHTARGR